MEDITEKRKHTRIEVDWPVLIDIGETNLTGTAINISLEGLCIRCDEPLPIDEIIFLNLVPDNHKSIGLYGKVIWSDLYGISEEDKAYGLGILFVQTAKIGRKQYEDLVTSLMSS